MSKAGKPSQRVRPKERHKHPKFTKWLRTRRCCMLGCQTYWLPVYGHHTRHRDDDRYQIPLCTACHFRVHAGGRKDGRKNLHGEMIDAFGFNLDQKAEEVFAVWSGHNESV